MDKYVWKQAHAEGKSTELAEKALRLASETPALLLEAIARAPVRKERDINRIHHLRGLFR